MAKIALIASSGGHLYQLFLLKEFWKDKDHFWVSFPTEDAVNILEDEKLFWAHYPTNRNFNNLIRNFIFALKLLREEKPDALMSTGAGIAVPFIFAGYLLGIKTLYLESITRNTTLSLSAKLVYPFVDRLFVQWPILVDRYRKTEFCGRVL